MAKASSDSTDPGRAKVAAINRRRGYRTQHVELQPPVLVPMTGEQYEEAVAALAELLAWAWERRLAA